MHGIFYLVPIVELVLGVLFFLYGKNISVGKIIVTSIFAITFILFLFVNIIERKALAVNKLFLN